jgi:hypothetical protein
MCSARGHAIVRLIYILPPLTPGVLRRHRNDLTNLRHLRVPRTTAPALRHAVSSRGTICVTIICANRSTAIIAMIVVHRVVSTMWTRTRNSLSSAAARAILQQRSLPLCLKVLLDLDRLVLDILHALLRGLSSRRHTI